MLKHRTCNTVGGFCSAESVSPRPPSLANLRLKPLGDEEIRSNPAADNRARRESRRIHSVCTLCLLRGE
eukprot:15142512-Heterocapsa_arctica.AAC.1